MPNDYDETVFDNDSEFVKMLLSSRNVIMYKPILCQKRILPEKKEKPELGEYYITHNLLPGETDASLNAVEYLREQLRNINKDEKNMDGPDLAEPELES